MSPAIELEALIASLGAPQEFRGMKPGLERIGALCSLLDNPQQKFTVIQVVGTNGKGSTTFYLAQMLLLGLGEGVGAFYSPHLLSFNERIRVNGCPVSDEELLTTLKKVINLGNRLAEKPSFFEVVTAAALDIFARSGIRYAVMEAGLGGRLDATTICQAPFGILTEVALDHCQILGSTISAILTEKLAAFSASKLVVAAPQGKEAAALLPQKCPAARLLTIDREWENALQVHGRLVCGRYRRRALATAWAMAREVAKTAGKVLDSAILAQVDVNFPGRLHFLQQNPPIIADISHNPAAIAELLSALDELPINRDKPWLLMYGAMRDKDISTAVSLLIPRCGQVLLPEIPGSRAACPADVAAYFPENFVCSSGGSIEDNCQKALSFLQSGAFCGLLACGSNFLAGPVIKYFSK